MPWLLIYSHSVYVLSQEMYTYLKPNSQGVCASG